MFIDNCLSRSIIVIDTRRLFDCQFQQSVVLPIGNKWPSVSGVKSTKDYIYKTYAEKISFKSIDRYSHI